MKKILLTLAVSIASTTMFAQGAKNIKINEVLTNNAGSVDSKHHDVRPRGQEHQDKRGADQQYCQFAGWIRPEASLGGTCQHIVFYIQCARHVHHHQQESARQKPFCTRANSADEPYSKRRREDANVRKAASRLLPQLIPF